jgi:phage terminase large subunit GpA-like protein
MPPELRQFVEAFRTAWHSPPRLELDEWADKHRVLSSEASAEPGRWRTDRVPYLREPMREISNAAVEQVVIVAASQSGKTEAVLNTLGYYIHQSPSPILCVEPRVEDCKALSKDRIAPMLRDCSALKGMVKDARSRDSGNTVLHKALAVDTPVPTPSGWTVMGDIVTGDTVFDETGTPCRVTYVTPIVQGRPCYRVWFSDGASIVADEDHPWQVERWRLKTVNGKKKQTVCTEIVSTDQLRAGTPAIGRKTYAIPVAGPLKTDAKSLSIDPYLLGAWLGDGFSHRAVIVAGAADGEMGVHLRQAGADGRLCPVTKNVFLFALDPEFGQESHCPRGHERTVAGTTSDGHCAECHRQKERRRKTGVSMDASAPNSFRTRLRSLGILKPTGSGPSLKAIPEDYLRASVEQRVALLQGLMDTDGSIREDGYCVFVTTLPAIAEGFADLLSGLGFQYNREEVIPTYTHNGVKKSGSLAYRFLFMPSPDRPVFRLSRKLARQTARVPQRMSKAARRRVVAVEPVDSVPVRCISVDSESHLYLAGREMIPTHNTYPGGHLTLAGANSAAGLSMRPIRVVLLDEVSRYPASAGTEGDPVTLAVKRTTTFWNRKIVMVSSPALEGSCRITAAYEETDQREYHLACPHCGEKQVLDWSRVEWKKEEDVSPRRHLPDTAHYHCLDCGKPWTDAQRWAALPHGEWIAKDPSRINRPGFRISQLYSPWKRMGELAREYLESRGNMEREKAFHNTVLALPYRVSGITADADRLHERRENYRRGTVPERALVLTAGVDVQTDRLECEVVGWGRGLESWSIDYLVLQGDPTRPEVWAKLDEQVRNEVWDREDGMPVKLSRIAIDSGDNTSAVYNYWRTVTDQRVMLIKGTGRSDTPLSQPRWVEVARQGRKVKRGVQVWSVAVDWFKDELSGFLRLPKPADDEARPGYCHFPHYPREHFDQLTAEEKVVERTKNGFQRHVWRKIRARNEGLDTRIYARAAAMAERLDAFRPRDWSKLEERLGVAPLAVPEPTPLPEVMAIPQAREIEAQRPRTGWSARGPVRGGWGSRR